MKQSKMATRVAGAAGDTLLRSVRGGGTPLPSDRIIGGDLRRGPGDELEGTPLPA